MVSIDMKWEIGTLVRFSKPPVAVGYDLCVSISTLVTIFKLQICLVFSQILNYESTHI